MSEPAAFFELEGDRFGPTVLTRGPWRPEHQHGGPPSALVARAIELAAGSRCPPARPIHDRLHPAGAD